MSMKANNIILHLHLPDHGYFAVPHTHDNAGQIRILFFAAGAAMKFDFHNKRVRLSNGVPNILPPVVLLFLW